MLVGDFESGAVFSFVVDFLDWPCFDAEATYLCVFVSLWSDSLVWVLGGVLPLSLPIPVSFLHLLHVQANLSSWSLSWGGPHLLLLPLLPPLSTIPWTSCPVYNGIRLASG